jgi:hypothetical protein
MVALDGFDPLKGTQLMYESIYEFDGQQYPPQEEEEESESGFYYHRRDESRASTGVREASLA